MKFAIYLLLPLASIYADPSFRIFGGNDAVEGQFPHHVSIQICGLLSCDLHCGGSIIAPQWVVSAGHCYSYGSKFQIVAGILNLKEDSEFKQIATVEKVFVHEDYIGNANPNDISLFKLNEPFVYNERIQPIALPEAGLEFTGPAVTSGWGQTGGNLFPILPDILQYLDSTILSGQDCMDALAAVLGNNRNPFNVTTNVCTEDDDGTRCICSGDSGGPLISNGTLIGISSWGIKPCCKKGAPSAFTRVSNYISWINNHTNEN